LHLKINKNLYLLLATTPQQPFNSFTVVNNSTAIKPDETYWPERPDRSHARTYTCVYSKGIQFQSGEYMFLSYYYIRISASSMLVSRAERNFQTIISTLAILCPGTKISTQIPRIRLPGPMCYSADKLLRIHSRDVGIQVSCWMLNVRCDSYQIQV